MRLCLVVWLLAVSFAVSARGQETSVGRGLDAIRWLAGCWELRRESRVTLEMWMAPAGGLMLGSSRTVVDGRLREFEHLMLREHEGHVIYTAVPSGQTETSFTAVAVTDSGFAVENLEHDFPQRITYRRGDADTFVARVEGPGPSGPRGFELPMRRVTCTP